LRAFVVGVSKYEYLVKLNNAVNDARAMVEYLQRHVENKEDVVYVYDCQSFELHAAFKKFVSLCRPGDFVIIFFAGHGCAFKNHQCLLARGLTTQEKFALNKGKKQLILESSLQVDKMLAKLRMKDVNKHLVLLDCCREFRVADLPRALEETMEEKDKAPFNIHLGEGTVIGYATAPGDRASDGNKGKSGHGYYTEALMNHLHKVNTDVDYMLREVGAEVYRKSGGLQNPHRDSCINEMDAYLFYK